MAESLGAQVFGSGITVGFVESIEGEVLAKSEDGTSRILSEGSAIYIDDEIITEEGSSVVIKNGEGSTLSFADGDSQTLSESYLAEQNYLDESDKPDAIAQEEFEGYAPDYVLGFVDDVNGRTYAVAEDGSERVLGVGNAIHFGDQIVTEDESFVIIKTENGEILTFANGESQLLSETFLAQQYYQGVGDSTATEAVALEGGEGYAPSYVVGYVEELTGRSTAVAEDGTERVLGVGNAIHFGEEIITEDGSEIKIVFNDAPDLNISPNSVAVIDGSLLDYPETDALVEEVASIEALQAALAAGEIDITELEATAAGGTGEDGGNDFVRVELEILEATPESGFPTDPIENEFPPIPEEDLAPNNPPDAMDDFAIPPNGIGATNDALVTEEDVPLQIQPLTLLNNDNDPDGDPLTIIGVSSPTNGTVVLNGDGTITFFPDPGFAGEATFIYTVSDGALIDSATVFIDVIPDSVPTLSIDGGSVVDEAALPDGSNPSSTAETTSGNFNIETGTDSVGSLVVGGINVTGGGVVVGAYGSLTVTESGGDYSWSYTLSDNTTDHPDPTSTGTPEGIQESFSVVVTDSDGDSDNENLVIDVLDDGPSANDDGQQASVDDNASNVNIGTVSGLLSDDNYGADGAHTTATTAFSVGAGNLGGSITVSGDNLLYTSATNVVPGVPQIETFTYTITDADGDTTTATFTVQLTDEKATIGEPTDSSVDEEGLSGNVDDPYDGDLAGSVTSVSGVDLDIDFGVDGAGTVTFDSTQTALDALSLTSGGDAVSWVLLSSNTVLVGYTGAVPTSTGDADVVFYASLSATGSGSYDFTQVEALDHPTIDTEDDIDLVFAFDAADAEGEGSSSSFTVTVDDDGPVNISPMPTIVVNSGDAQGFGLLDSFGHFGADQPGTVVFDSKYDGWTLQDGGGENVTVDGFDVVLSLSVGNTVLTGTADGTTVFTITLDPDSDDPMNDVHIEFFQDFIDDGSRFDDFSAAPAGKNFWIGLDADGGDIDAENNDSNDILITAYDISGGGYAEQRLNTDSDDIGVENQFIDGSEGVRLDFVVDVRREAGLIEKDSKAFDYDDHHTADTFSFKIVEVNGGPTNTTVVKIEAWTFDDAALDPDELQLSSTAVALLTSSIIVRDELGNDVTDPTKIHFDNADKTVYIEGLKQGWTVTFTGASEFEAVEITNADGLDVPDTISDTFSGHPFSLGGFVIAGEGSQVDFEELDVIITDRDGDTAVGTIDISVTPDIGTATGSESAESILGGSGDDLLIALGGNDYLTGGAGDDTLSGGAGSDTFVWLSGDEGTDVDPAEDTLTTFDIGVSDNDVLDLSDLLQGEDGSNTADLANYLSFTEVSGDTIISVDADGAGGDGVSQTIILTGVDITAGNTLTDVEVLDNLLGGANPNLNVD